MFTRYKRGYKRYGNNTTKIIWAILIFCLLIMCFCGYKIFVATQEYNQGNNVYEKLAENKSTDKQIDFAALSKINSDIVGWISCAGIGLDYPIVRGGDNNYYLTHLFDGTKNKLGSIFMDYRNNPEFQDKNTVIYGHHMKNGAMFSTLMDYKDQEFLNDHPRIEIDTPNGPLTMKIFSGFIVNTTEFEAKCQFANNVEFMEYINKAIAQSCFETRVNVKPTDKIVTLYTCSYEYDGARFVLMGVI